MKHPISRTVLSLCLLSFVATSCGGHSAAVPNSAHASAGRFARHFISCTAPTNALSPVKNAGYSTTPSTSFPTAPAVGDLLVAGVEIVNNSLSELSDPIWTRIETPGMTGGEHLVVEYHYVTTADSNTFTWTLTNSSPWAVAVQDLTCTATSAPVDASSSTYFGNSTGGTTSTITGHVNDLPVAFFGMHLGNETDTPRNPWTEQAFKTETDKASISLQNNLPLVSSFLTATGGDTWSAAGENSGAVLLVKPLSLPSTQHVSSWAFTQQATPAPSQMCPWTTIAEDGIGRQADLISAGCIAELYTDPTRQANDGPNCLAHYGANGCPESIFAHNDVGSRLEKSGTNPTIYELALGGASTGCSGNNNAQGATIAAMENDELGTDSNVETPFFDTVTPFGLTPTSGSGSSFPCGYTSNSGWYDQYLSMINAVNIPGIANGAGCTDSSDCMNQSVDGGMYLLNSSNVVGMMKEDCMNQTSSPPNQNQWIETVRTAVAVRKGGTDPYGRSFPGNKFYVCRGFTVSGLKADSSAILAIRQWALATFWLTYDEQTGSIGGKTGVPHSVYSTPWATDDGFTVLPEVGFVCTSPVKSDSLISDYTDLSIRNSGNDTGAYGREWNSCSLWTGPSGSQTSDGPCAVISVPGTSAVAWSSVLPGLQNGLRYTKSLVLTGQDPLASPAGTALFTGTIPTTIPATSGLTVCQT